MLYHEDLNKRRPTYTSLTDSAPKHTEGEEQEVQDVLKKYTVLQDMWTTAVDTMDALLKRSKPWKDLTDGFDELSTTVDRVESLVESNEQSVAQLDEAEGGDLSDLIVNFKVRARGWEGLAPINS